MYYRDENNQWQEIILPPSGDTLPIGAITEFAGATPPSGWLICDGRAISRTTYSELFGVIGTTYGSGDGSTTFNIPDYTGKVGVGLNSNDSDFNVLGETGGEKAHTLNMTELPDIKMYAGSNGDWPLVASGGLGTQTSCAHCTNANVTQEANVTRSVYTAHRQGESSGQAHNNLQPYITINYIIKAKQKIAIVGSVTNDINNADVDSVPNTSTVKNYVDSKNIYSTTETVVGTWGGEILYRKIIAGNMSQENIAHNIGNLKDIKKIYGTMHNTNSGKYFSVPSTRPAYPEYEIGLFADSTNVTLERGSNVRQSYMTIEIIIEYTKTTV